MDKVHRYIIIKQSHTHSEPPDVAILVEYWDDWVSGSWCSAIATASSKPNKVSSADVITAVASA